jgi:hypothetical protein
MGHPFAFIAEWNVLLPLVNFIEEPSSSCAWLVTIGGVPGRRRMQLAYEALHVLRPRGAQALNEHLRRRAGADS